MEIRYCWKSDNYGILPNGKIIDLSKLIALRDPIIHICTFIHDKWMWAQFPNEVLAVAKKKKDLMIAWEHSDANPTSSVITGNQLVDVICNISGEEEYRIGEWF